MDLEALAGAFLKDMASIAPQALAQRFKIDALDGEPAVLLERACQGRGWLLSGGRYDTLRGARVVLDEYRSGKLGRISLETPPREAFE